MTTKRFSLRTKLYVESNGGELRRIRRRDGFSFTTTTVPKGKSDKHSVSIATDLQFTSQYGTLLITMRKTALRANSWHCTTSTISLSPHAADDLIQSLTLLKARLMP